jgi:hypothetical protein
LDGVIQRLCERSQRKAPAEPFVPFGNGAVQTIAALDDSRSSIGRLFVPFNDGVPDGHAYPFSRFTNGQATA